MAGAAGSAGAATAVGFASGATVASGTMASAIGVRVLGWLGSADPGAGTTGAGSGSGCAAGAASIDGVDSTATAGATGCASLAASGPRAGSTSAVVGGFSARSDRLVTDPLLLAPRKAPATTASVRLAPSRSALARSAPPRLAPCRFAPRRLAPDRSASESLAPARLAPSRFTPFRSVRVRSAPARSQEGQARVSISCRKLCCTSGREEPGGAACTRVADGGTTTARARARDAMRYFMGCFLASVPRGRPLRGLSSADKRRSAKLLRSMCIPYCGSGFNNLSPTGAHPPGLQRPDNRRTVRPPDLVRFCHDTNS